MQSQTIAPSVPMVAVLVVQLPMRRGEQARFSRSCISRAVAWDNVRPMCYTLNREKGKPMHYIASIALRFRMWKAYQRFAKVGKVW